LVPLTRKLNKRDWGKLPDETASYEIFAEVALVDVKLEAHDPGIITLKFQPRGCFIKTSM